MITESARRMPRQQWLIAWLARPLTMVAEILFQRVSTFLAKAIASGAWKCMARPPHAYPRHTQGESSCVRSPSRPWWLVAPLSS
jgi:hypothetical protein